MDTFDGLYARKKKMLKAMKDSRVGSFGVLAMLVITLLQLGSFLKIGSKIIYTLPLILFWGRFSTLFHINYFQYLSYKKNTISHKKYWRGLKEESKISLQIIVLIVLPYLIFFVFQKEFIKLLIIFIASLLCSYITPTFLGKKVGGFNGDTCGASVVITETMILFIHAIVL